MSVYGESMPVGATPPTAELHVHIEGTLEPEMILALAGRHGVRLPTTDLDEFRARYAFTDLQSFLDLHYANLQVLRSEEDFYELAVAYLGRAHECNVRRAEIFFDPQTHTANGVSLGAVVNGLAAGLRDGERRHGVSAELIMCFLRHLGADAADEMFTAMLPFRDHIIGVGLDSTEIGFPNPLFADVFARAAADGLHLVAHAGEEGDAQAVAETLDSLHVERIDHGVRAMDDPEVVARLRDDQTPLTVCPLSNVRLHVVDTLADHPLAAHARCRPSRHRQQRRPGLLRRIRRRQLPGSARRAPVDHRPAGDPGTQLVRRQFRPTRAPRGVEGRGPRLVHRTSHGRPREVVDDS